MLNNYTDHMQNVYYKHFYKHKRYPSYIEYRVVRENKALHMKDNLRDP